MQDPHKRKKKKKKKSLNMTKDLSRSIEVP
jgi:hypothetical protein